jgi:hypothetical protein
VAEHVPNLLRRFSSDARRRLRRSAVVAAAVVLGASGSLLATLPAQAASHTYYLDSRDGGARAQVTITWYSATRYSADWTNCDIRADSRGPILFIQQQSRGGLLNGNVYDHNLGGKNLCDGQYSSIANGFDTERVQIRECNGGSRYSPENCDVDYIDNPLND